MSRARRLGAAAVGVCVLSFASAASAGNGPEPRTPIDWTGAPCMTIVDRSVSATVHLDYGIPMEDVEVTDDEVEDSRTLQFFGFCRALDPQTYLPRWITLADVERARDIGIAPETVNAQNVMETNTDWVDCWHRINADDDRRPITYAAAEEGILWDTTGLAVGTYVVEGYTWEPPLNIWSSRPGVIKVVDDPDPALSPPAVGITNTKEIIDQSESVTIGGCASSEDGSWLTAAWGVPAGEVTWNTFIEHEPVLGESFAIEFDPPPELAGESVMIRVEITDPSGRSDTHYMRDLVYILGDPYPECEESAFIDPGCDETGSTGDAETGDVGSTSAAGSTSSAGTTSGTGPAQDGVDDDPGGCGSCRAAWPDAPDEPVRAGLLLLALAGLRRRRGSLGGR